MARDLQRERLSLLRISSLWKKACGLPNVQSRRLVSGAAPVQAQAPNAPDRRAGGGQPVEADAPAAADV
jgi:hypothetical protein